MLDTLDAWLDEFPPLENAQRFGNKAFRSWVEKLVEVRRDFLQKYNISETS